MNNEFNNELNNQNLNYQYEDQPTKSKKGKIFIIIILAIILVVLGCIGFFINKKIDKNEDEPNNTEQKFNGNPTNPETSAGKLATAFKEYYTNLGFVNESNVDKWEITNIEKIDEGYYEGYYGLKSQVTCKDKSTTCVYKEKIISKDKNSGTYNIYFYVKVKEENNNFIIENEAWNAGLSTSDQKLAAAFKKYYEKKGYTVKDDLKDWTINKISTEDGYTKFEGTFTCGNEPTCLQLVKPGEATAVTVESATYDFLMYAKVSESNGTYTFSDLRGSLITEYIPPQPPVQTKEEKLIAAFKAYYEKNGYIDKKDMQEWTITKVTEEKGYTKFEGTFTCGNEPTCVYMVNPGEAVAVTVESATYDFLMYAKVSESNGTYTFSDLRGSLGDSKKEALIAAFKAYYEKNGYIDKKDMQEWTITKVTEEKGYTKFEGTFTCGNEPTCVYMPVPGEVVGVTVESATYEFVMYVKVSESNGKYTFSDLRGSIN